MVIKPGDNVKNQD